MKKILLSIVFLFGIFFSSQAQSVDTQEKSEKSVKLVKHANTKFNTKVHNEAQPSLKSEARANTKFNIPQRKQTVRNVQQTVRANPKFQKKQSAKIEIANASKPTKILRANTKFNRKQYN